MRFKLPVSRVSESGIFGPDDLSLYRGTRLYLKAFEIAGLACDQGHFCCPAATYNYGIVGRAAQPYSLSAERKFVNSDAVLDFLQFIEGQKNQSVRGLLDRILRKSRMMTSAEAGTIFIARKRGKRRWLEPASVQNDAITVRKTDFVVPIGPGSIAGHVANKGQTGMALS